MSDDLTPYRAASLPLYRQLMPDRESDVIRSHCRSGSEYEFGKLMMLNPPTAKQRTKLDTRHRAIAANLSSHNQHEIATAVADVISCYRNFVKEHEDPKKVIAKYVKELNGIPTWACVRACTAIRNGEAKNISFQYPFSTMQLRVLAEGFVSRLRDEAREISEVLLGGKLTPPASPEVRAKIQRNLERLAFRLRANSTKEHQEFARPITERKMKRLQEDIIRDYERRGETPYVTGGLIISPQLLNIMGVRNVGGSSETTPGMETGKGET